MRKVILIAAVLLALAVIFMLIKTFRWVVQTDPKRARKMSESVGMPVEVQRVRTREIKQVVGASCVVEQGATVTLTARLNSRITAVPHDIGDVVKEGEVLVEWDDRLYRAEVQEAEETVRSAEIALQNAGKQFQRLTKLAALQMGAALDVEAAETAEANARQALAAARQSLIAAEIELENAVLRSPVDGIVLERMAHPGEHPEVGGELLTLGDLKFVYAVAQLGEPDLPSASLGMAADVTFQSAYLGQVFEGELVKIDPVIDPTTRSFAAYIRLENPDLRLKPGLAGFVRLHRVVEAPAVPNTAILNPTGTRATVFVVDPQTSRVGMREVQIGVVSDGLTEVVQNLKVDELVVAVGQLSLRENDKVHFQPPRD